MAVELVNQVQNGVRGFFCDEIDIEQRHNVVLNKKPFLVETLHQQIPRDLVVCCGDFGGIVQPLDLHAQTSV